MSPALIELALQVLLKYGPDFYNRIIDAIHKPNPTADDWRIAAATPNLDKLVAETTPTSIALLVTPQPN